MYAHLLAFYHHIFYINPLPSYFHTMITFTLTPFSLSNLQSPYLQLFFFIFKISQMDDKNNNINKFNLNLLFSQLLIKTLLPLREKSMVVVSHQKTTLSSPRSILRKSWLTTWKAASKMILIGWWIALIFLMTTQLFRHCLLLHRTLSLFQNSSSLFLCFFFCLSVFLYL